MTCQELSWWHRRRENPELPPVLKNWSKLELFSQGKRGELILEAQIKGPDACLDRESFSKAKSPGFALLCNMHLGSMQAHICQKCARECTLVIVRCPSVWNSPLGLSVLQLKCGAYRRK